MNARSAIVLAAACAALAGCGGGGGGGGSGPVNTTSSAGDVIPDSALVSASSLVAYLQQLIAGTNETSEPVGLGNATLPVDDTAEPASI